MIETTRFQQGSLKRVKNKKAPGTWFFRYREDSAGRRVYRNLKIGTVQELPHRRDAENAVLALRVKINSGVRSPDTVDALIAHYTDARTNGRAESLRHHRRA